MGFELFRAISPSLLTMGARGLSIIVHMQGMTTFWDAQLGNTVQVDFLWQEGFCKGQRQRPKL